MKLTEAERRGIEQGLKDLPTLRSLVQALDGSALTRSDLCAAIAGMLFTQARGNAAEAREATYE